MIWHFDDTQTYLLGSIHSLRDNDNNHLNLINDTYRKSTKVIFETSLDFGDISYITLYKNDSLSKHISKTLFRDTKKSWLKYGLQYSELEKSKIWSATLSITNSILGDSGFIPENGIDRIIWDKAHKDNKIIEWLESQKEGLSCFDNSPIEEQQSELIKAARNKNKIINEISMLVDMWNTCNEERLSNFLYTCLDELPVLYNSLVIERNSSWLDKFTSVLNSDTPTLFVVGALHCVSEHSIQNMLLEKHGHTSKLINTIK